MKVWIESPYAGDVERNLEYLHECARWLTLRGMWPMCSHGWFTQFLNDDDPSEREQGIAAGFRWQRHASKLVVCTRHGVSGGMRAGILNWLRGREVASALEMRDCAGGAMSTRDLSLDDLRLLARTQATGADDSGD